MRCCANCQSCNIDIRGRYICDILHTEVFLNDDGCIYHEMRDYNPLD